MTLPLLSRKHAELELHDKLDDLGIGILAAPSVMEGMGSLLQRVPRAGVQGAGRALHGLGETLHSSPAYNLPGYALVAPSITHGLADALGGDPSAQKLAGMREALSLFGF